MVINMRRVVGEKKNRNPLIVLVCEGKNKTETNYFKHFIKRDNPYTLKPVKSEATDIKSMTEKAKRLYREYDMDRKVGDRMFCVFDMDLDANKYEKYKKLKKANPNIEYIVSNPCFEIWLLYYFTENPKIVNSSQKVKEELKKYVPDYEENMDIVKVKGLEEDYAIAINRADKRNALHGEGELYELNPYTEVHELITLLLDFH